MRDGLPNGSAPSSRGTGDAYSFESRFGVLLRSEGIAAIPAALLHRQGQLGLSAGEVWVLCQLLAHRWTASAPYPSVRRLARKTGIPRGSIHGWIESLEARGLIRVEREDTDHAHQVSRYFLEPLFARLEALIAAGAAQPPLGGVAGPPATPEGGWPAHRPGVAGPPARGGRPTGHMELDSGEEDSGEEDSATDLDFLRQVAGELRRANRWRGRDRELALELGRFADARAVDAAEVARLARIANELAREKRTPARPEDFWHFLDVAREAFPARPAGESDPRAPT